MFGQMLFGGYIFSSNSFLLKSEEAGIQSFVQLPTLSSLTDFIYNVLGDA